MADNNTLICQDEDIKRFFDKSTKPFLDKLRAEMQAELDKEILSDLLGNSVSQYDDVPLPLIDISPTHFIHLPESKPNLYTPPLKPLLYVPKPKYLHADLTGKDLTGWTCVPVTTPYYMVAQTPRVSVDDFIDGCDACGEGDNWTLRKCHIKSLRLIAPVEPIELCDECAEHKDAMYFLTTIRAKGQLLGRRLAERHIEIEVGEPAVDAVTMKELLTNGVVGSIWSANLHVSNCSAYSAINANQYVNSLINVPLPSGASVCYNCSV